MGLFNYLKMNISCTECNTEIATACQFHYGSCRLYEYSIGDTLRWGGNDIGDKTATMVMIRGYLDDTKCPSCSKVVAIDEYDIILNNNVLRSVSPIKDVNVYLVPYEDYVILEK